MGVIPNGKRLREIREQKGYSRKALEAEGRKLYLHLSRSVIFKAEAGGSVSRDTIEALARVLNVPYNELVQPGYQLHEVDVSIPQRSEETLVKLHLGHRSVQRSRLEKALSSGQDVLWLTVMSQAITKSFGPLLVEATKAQTRLRVLTWDPEVPEQAIEAYRRHIDEYADEPSRTVEQVRNAARDWVIINLTNPWFWSTIRPWNPKCQPLFKKRSSTTRILKIA